MQFIPVAAPPAAPAAGPPPLADASGQQALAGLVGAIGDDDFAAAGLAHLNRWMPVGWWAVYRLFDDAPPALHAQASFGVPDGTGASWQAYRHTLYRFDDTFQAARDTLGADEVGVMHRHAREIPPRQRAAIYQRHRLRERLSVVAPRSRGGLLALNLFRHHSQPGFSDDEIDRVCRISRPLLACVERHVALQARLQPGAAVFAALSAREREVCERLLKGWTHEGIAADLEVSPATVKTYRDRAFDRLGIHHRNELYERVLRGRLP